MSQIIIQLEGGLVQDAYVLKDEAYPSNEPTSVVIVDFDVEGGDPDEITTVKGTDGFVLEACVHEETLSNLPEGSDIYRILKEWRRA